MKQRKLKYCPTTKKFCYSSEAKAQRALNRYDEIQRIYHCSDCDGWHSTSMDSETSSSFGYIEEPDEVSSGDIRKRLKKLLKKKD